MKNVLEGDLEGVVGVAVLGVQRPAHLEAQFFQTHVVRLGHVGQNTVHRLGLKK